MWRALVFLPLLTVLFAGPAFGHEHEEHAAHAEETPEEREQRLEWWKSGRFGMFVHWGIYSVVGGEYRGQKLPNSAEWMMCRGRIPIAEYEEYAARFNPTKFDAKAFVGLAKQAGMTYLVITAKHHDGFAMFDSECNPFNVVDATPFKRDIMRELAEECQKQGLKFGFYYSQAQDWHHPGGFGNNWDKSLKRVSSDEYVFNKAVPEVEQLLTDYGPIGIFWWDTPRKMSKEAFNRLHSLTSIQRDIITNDRLGEEFQGDYKTFERKIPKAAPPEEDWEVCMPISGSWGYKLGDNNFKSTSTLIRNLADIASKGGNYLLNVSPTGEGTLLPQATERLEAIGAWMQVNNESIYGTSASPFGKLDWGRCTMKATADGKKLYLHVFDWPEDGRLVVPGLKNSVERAYLLANGGSVDASTTDEGAVVSLPSDAPDAINSVVVLEAPGELQIESEDPSRRADGTMVLLAESAYLHNNEGSPEIRVQDRGDSVNLGYWTDEQAWVEWSVDVAEPGEYDVLAEVAIEGPSTRLGYGLPGALVMVDVASTGSYGNYETRRLGTVVFRGAGPQSFRIRPDADNWSPVNLRKLELKPVSDK